MDSRAGEGAMHVHSDNEDQLQLGIRIITTAFQNKVHSLEQEIRGYRLQVDEHKSSITTMQRKSSSLEVELVESHQRTQQLSDEKRELLKTKESLMKQIQRLDGLKQAVLASINEDSAAEAALGDTRHLFSEEFLKNATPLTAAELGHRASPASRPTERGPPHAGAPALSAPSAQPAALPQTYHQEYHQEVSPRPPRPMSTAANSPPALSPAPQNIDGKQFFRQARSRLSYEAFNAFLASIKRLNNSQQTREETLDEARRILGPELQDLYRDFETLLNRHSL